MTGHFHLAIKKIYGRNYDTEKAIKVAAYWNGRTASDVHYIHKVLYVIHNNH